MIARGRSKADMEMQLPYPPAKQPHTGTGKSVPLSLGILWPRCPRYYATQSEAVPMARSAIGYAMALRRGIQIGELTPAGASAILFVQRAIEILEDDARAEAIREARPKGT